MAATPNLETLIARLGHAVTRERLTEALTHPSATSAARPSYERLEFLGDRVLNLLIAEALLARHPRDTEGQLALRLNALVRRETVAQVAVALGLGPYLHLARAESVAGGRRRETILCDAMEAVIATIFLDCGLDAARDTVARLWGPLLDGQGKAAVTQDAKTALQEWAQARGMPPPAYVTIARRGPDHAPHFTVEARLQSGQAAHGAATSKRAAEQAAASALLSELPDD
jgi:ribonuclease-3